MGGRTQPATGDDVKGIVVTPKTLQRLGRAAIWSGSIAGAIVLLVGLLHTRVGRPLLGQLGLGGCPVAASAEDVEHARMASARATRGIAQSPSRPALGFQLDSMTRGDVEAWAERHHIACESARSDTLLRCARVPADAIGEAGPEVDALTFGFVPKTLKLVNITAVRHGLDGEHAATQMETIASHLRSELGAPEKALGDRTATYLSGGDLRTAIVTYRFADYIADVTATNIPGRGLMLREHYMSAKDD